MLFLLTFLFCKDVLRQTHITDTAAYGGRIAGEYAARQLFMFWTWAA